MVFAARPSVPEDTHGLTALRARLRLVVIHHMNAILEHSGIINHQAWHAFVPQSGVPIHTQPRQAVGKASRTGSALSSDCSYNSFMTCICAPLSPTTAQTLQ